MDSVGLFVLFLFVGVLFGIIKHFYDIIVALINYFKRDYFSKYIPPRPLKARYKSVLEQHFTFYKKLTLKNKKHFEWRVQKFIDMKEFIPRGSLQEVSPSSVQHCLSLRVQPFKSHLDIPKFTLSISGEYWSTRIITTVQSHNSITRERLI